MLRLCGHNSRVELYTQEELAQYLKLHPATLARWRLASRGPAWIEVGGQFRYRREDVESWLAEHTKGNGESA